MPLFKQNFPAPVGGVSQAPPEVRGPGYADDMVNAFPSSVRGLGVRKGTVAKATGLGALDESSAHVAVLRPSDTERYLTIIDKNGIRVIDDVTGASKFVTLASGAAAMLAAGGISSAAVGDDLYVATKASKATLTGTAVTTPPAGTLITVESGRPSALYQITLDGIAVSVRTPDDPPPQVKRPAIGLALTTGQLSTINLSVTPSGISLLPGHSEFLSVTLNRTTYTGTVNLAVTGTTGGVSAVLGTSAFSYPGSDSTTLTISVAEGTEPGPGSVSIRATGTDLPFEDTTISVMVLDPATSGGGSGGGGGTGGAFSVLQASGSVDVAAGSSGIQAWSISRVSGYVSDVVWGYVSLPTGITLSSSPTAFSGSTSLIYMTANVASDVAPGTYVITMKFTGAGSLDQMRNFYINVSEAGGGGGAPAITWNPGNQHEVYESGSSGFVDLQIVRSGGYTGDVSVEVATWDTGTDDGAPSFSPTTIAYPLVTSRLSYSLAGRPAGTYSISFRAIASGLPTVYSSLTIHYSP